MCIDVFENNRYFNEHEFMCPCCGGCDMDIFFIELLTSARIMAGVKFIINSGFRCPAHNVKVGGKSTSAHLEGLAADIRCPNSHYRSRIISALIFTGFHRIGIGQDFIHVDLDPYKPAEVAWLY